MTSKFKYKEEMWLGLLQVVIVGIFIIGIVGGWILARELAFDASLPMHFPARPLEQVNFMIFLPTLLLIWFATFAVTVVLNVLHNIAKRLSLTENKDADIEPK